MKKLTGILLSLTMVTALFSHPVYAEETVIIDEITEETVNDDAGITETDESEPLYTRTIMMYDCGSNLETFSGLATYNLRQILNSSFSAGDRVKYIIMTGGSWVWHTPSELLVDPDHPDEAITIDEQYNQIWEARGKDADEYAGKMVLLEKEGLHGTKAEQTYEIQGEIMSDPQLLKDFIDYCAENYPAEKYDLILWDHGGGPIGGFASDQNDSGGGSKIMHFDQIIDAFSDNAVTRDGGKFDMIDFDACLMGSVEMILAFADYTDYYIASPELVPGYGQYYEGWLSLLSDSPDMDTFEIGKKIVDDFIAFYDKPEGDGSSQEGTLAVVDMNRMLNSGLTETLLQFSGMLAYSAMNQDSFTSDYLFYDEFDSIKNCIHYGDNTMDYYDLGTLAAQFCYDFKELTMNDIIDEETVIDQNIYTETMDILSGVLYNPEMIYARGTQGIHSESIRYRDIYGRDDYSHFGTSGMYIFFPSADYPSRVYSYAEELKPAIEKLPESSKTDQRRDFLEAYVKALADYSLIAMTGKGVSGLLDEGKERSEINFDSVKLYLSNGAEKDPRDIYDPDFDGWAYMVSDWAMNVIPLMRIRAGLERSDENDELAEAMAKEWLSEIIRQQADENIRRDDMTLYAIEQDEGTGYRIDIENTQKRIIDDIRYNLNIHLPAADQFIEDNYDDIGWGISDRSIIDVTTIGKVSGELVYETKDGTPVEESSMKEYLEWYMNPSSSWTLAPLDETWYVIQDAEGYMHVADINTSGEEVWFQGIYTKENGEEEPVYLDFFNGILTDIYFNAEGGGPRQVPVSEFTGTLEVMPVREVGIFLETYNVPLSKKPIILSPETVHSITAVKADINGLEDIFYDDPDDPYGGYSGVERSIVIRDIYGYETCFSEEDAIPAGSGIERIWFTQPEYEMPYGTDMVLIAHTEPEDAEDPLTFTSSDENIVKMESNLVHAAGAGKATVTVTAPNGVSASCDIRVQFTDVKDKGKYYYEPVNWAVDNGITTGTSPAKFSPSDPCTREQIVTFLWRLKGEPEPETDSDFTDVAKDKWYYKPISWAYENHITTGLNDGTGRFGVGQPCTREQCVTFLYRAADSPPVTSHESFTDVKEGKYYYDAVSWAASKKITVGLNDGTGRFGVGQKCTRAMIVTFLYRYNQTVNVIPTEK